MLHLSNHTYTPFHSVFEGVAGIIHQYDLRNYCATDKMTPRGAPSGVGGGWGSLSNTQSRRTPDMRTHFNAADRIDRQLEKCDEDTWGFVIYRGTYSDNTEWAEFLSRLQQSMEESLTFYKGLDMLDYFSLTVLEDPIRFNNVNTSVIRDDFDRWATRETERLHNRRERRLVRRSQRYEFCIYVDQEAIDSILQEDTQVGAMGWRVKGWVKLILRDHDRPYIPNDPPMHEDEVEEEYESVEGNTHKDVGWMRVDYQGVMITFYNYFDNWNFWHTAYRRPPEIAQG